MDSPSRAMGRIIKYLLIAGATVVAVLVVAAVLFVLLFAVTTSAG